MSFRALAPAAMAAAVLLTSAAGVSEATPILSGLYRLHNHPDGAEANPLYGARFDELYNATSNHDVFTLDFDNIQSAMYLTVNTARTEIHIFGQAFGGRDIGTAYANDSYKGVYTLDFTYSLGVTQSPGDDDLQVNTPDMRASGSIQTPLGHTIRLVDKAMDTYSFRFGDEDNDLGHRGFNGISGWGWMNYVRDGQVVPHIDSTDWLFTASYQIPAPGAGALAGIGGLLLVRRRQR